MPLERLLPQSIEAEKGVLGSIIIDPSVIPAVLQILDPEDFYRDAHRTIFEAIRSLDARREPADFLMICDYLENQGKLADVGGASYLTSLIDGVPTSGNVEFYANIVQKTSQRRRLIQAAGQIAAIAYEEADADLALNQAEALLRAIGNRKRADTRRDMADILFDYMTQLEKLSGEWNGASITGVPTSYGELDTRTGGLQKSDLIILAARPGQGKTALALALAARVAQFGGEMGFKVLFFSLEMASWQLAQRYLAGEGRVDQSRLRIAQLEGEEWDSLILAQDKMPEGRLWIDDEPGLRIQEIRSRARRHQAEYGLDLLVVDFAQLVKAVDDHGRPFNSTREEVSYVAREMKNVARELNIPVILLSQLNRSVEGRADKMPQLSDLKETGALEEAADLVLFLYQDPADLETEEGYILNLLFAKFRNGSKKPVKLFFKPRFTWFEDVDQFALAPVETGTQTMAPYELDGTIEEEPFD